MRPSALFALCLAGEPLLTAAVFKSAEAGRQRAFELNQGLSPIRGKCSEPGQNCTVVLDNGGYEIKRYSHYNEHVVDCSEHYDFWFHGLEASGGALGVPSTEDMGHDERQHV
ncbi:hypothetical protein O9K51_04815 [Purpureocillium lavendulum]|uniref:Uncharacterized protein n=1 Tax=Purpureocillium lavendulum TaxID=1247861 RepID=A0AB34FZ61_9HYPO|nr:hypothetical protein O9K51_04815 [Purpureocillium lavendulum]